MATSTQLQQDINNLNTQKSTYQDRKRELQSVKKKMNNSLPSWKDKVNTNIDNAESYFTTGLSGSTSKSKILSSLSDLRQANVEADSKLKAVISNIDDEITRCTNKISSLETDISAKNNALKAAQKEEQEKAKEAG